MVLGKKCSQATREEAHSSEQEKLHNSAWAFLGIALSHNIGNRPLPGYCVTQLNPDNKVLAKLFCLAVVPNNYSGLH